MWVQIISVQHPTFHCVPLSCWFSFWCRWHLHRKKHSHPLEVKRKAASRQKKGAGCSLPESPLLNQAPPSPPLAFVLSVSNHTASFLFLMCLFHPVVSWFMTMQKLLGRGEEKAAREGEAPSIMSSPQGHPDHRWGHTKSASCNKSHLCLSESLAFWRRMLFLCSTKKKTFMAESLHQRPLIPVRTWESRRERARCKKSLPLMCTEILRLVIGVCSIWKRTRLFTQVV